MVVTVPPKIYDSLTQVLNCTICGWNGKHGIDSYLYDPETGDEAADNDTFLASPYIEFHDPLDPALTQVYCPNHEWNLIENDPPMETP